MYTRPTPRQGERKRRQALHDTLSRSNPDLSASIGSARNVSQIFISFHSALPSIRHRLLERKSEHNEQLGELGRPRQQGAEPVVARNPSDRHGVLYGATMHSSGRSRPTSNVKRDTGISSIVTAVEMGAANLLSATGCANFGEVYRAQCFLTPVGQFIRGPVLLVLLAVSLVNVPGSFHDR